MTTVPKTVPMADAWEAGEFKWSDDVAQLNEEEEIDQELIDGLKLIAKRKGIAYQPLVRQVLSRFVEADLKGASEAPWSGNSAPWRRRIG